jgi:hypothetical protein
MLPPVAFIFGFKIIKLFLCTPVKMYTNLTDFTKSHLVFSSLNLISLRGFKSRLCCHERFLKAASSYMSRFLKVAENNIRKSAKNWLPQRLWKLINVASY